MELEKLIKEKVKKTHDIYIKIAFTARKKDSKLIKELINKIDDDVLKSLKSIGESW